MNLASLIKSARESAGLSQSQAAKAWNITLKTLQSWEQGVRRPGAAHFAQVLDIIAPEIAKHVSLPSSERRPGSRSKRARKGT